MHKLSKILRKHCFTEIPFKGVTSTDLKCVRHFRASATPPPPCACAQSILNIKNQLFLELIQKLVHFEKKNIFVQVKTRLLKLVSFRLILILVFGKSALGLWIVVNFDQQMGALHTIH